MATTDVRFCEPHGLMQALLSPDNTLGLQTVLGAIQSTGFLWYGSSTRGFNWAARIKVDEEVLTLSTGGLTTDTTANLLPANSLILAVNTVITTTITTATNWAVGDPTTSARFSAANATKTAGTNQVGITQWSGAITTLAAGPSQASAAKVRITCTGSNPGAGAIAIQVVSLAFTAPTS